MDVVMGVGRRSLIGCKRWIRSWMSQAHSLLTRSISRQFEGLREASHPRLPAFHNNMMLQQTQPLLTPTSLALALSPPRSPPPDSLIYHLHHCCIHDLLRNNHVEIKTLLSKTPCTSADDSDVHATSHKLLTRLLIKICQLEELDYNKHTCQCSKPIPLFQLSITDRITRYLGSTLPLKWQHDFRDSGRFRSVADGIVKLT